MKTPKRKQDSNIPIAGKEPNKAEDFMNFLHEDNMIAFRQYELSQLNLDKDKDEPNDMPNGLEEKLDSIYEKIKKDMLEMENRLRLIILEVLQDTDCKRNEDEVFPQHGDNSKMNKQEKESGMDKLKRFAHRN